MKRKERIDSITYATFLQSEWEANRALDVSKFTKPPSDRCGRCGISTTSASSCSGGVRDAIGGKADNVVCPYHRICHDCWFSPSVDDHPPCAPSDYLKGVRAKEPSHTAHLPLTSNPFGKLLPRCPGCRQGMEMHIIKAKLLYETSLRNQESRANVIDLEADDTSVASDVSIAPIPPIVIASSHGAANPLHVVLNLNAHRIECSLPPTVRLYMLLSAIAVAIHVPTSDVSMQFDGDQVNPLSCASDYDLEDGDLLDVHVHQTEATD
jgi:hypothetical protein